MKNLGADQDTLKDLEEMETDLKREVGDAKEIASAATKDLNLARENLLRNNRKVASNNENSGKQRLPTQRRSVKKPRKQRETAISSSDDNENSEIDDSDSDHTAMVERELQYSDDDSSHGSDDNIAIIDDCNKENSPIEIHSDKSDSDDESD